MADAGSCMTLLLDTRSSEPQPYITTVFGGVEALRGFRRIQLLKQPKDKAPMLAQRQQEQTEWQEAIGAWSHRTGKECILFYDLHSVSTGPCEDWFKNIWLAFEDPAVERIVYLPYDIALTPEGSTGQPPSAELVENLQAFVDEADRANDSGKKADLLLGTYDVEGDVPKNRLEEFTILELFRGFPFTMKWLGWTGWDGHKPRTGYFALSRRLYEEFRDRRPFRHVMMPYGGTFQLILCAALVTRATERHLPGANQRFLIREWGPIMKVEEGPMAPIDFRVGHQRLRTSFVMEDERMYWSRRWDLAL